MTQKEELAKLRDDLAAANARINSMQPPAASKPNGLTPAEQAELEQLRAAKAKREAEALAATQAKARPPHKAIPFPGVDKLTPADRKLLAFIAMHKTPAEKLSNPKAIPGALAVKVRSEFKSYGLSGEQVDSIVNSAYDRGVIAIGYTRPDKANGKASKMIYWDARERAQQDDPGYTPKSAAECAAFKAELGL